MLNSTFENISIDYVTIQLPRKNKKIEHSRDYRIVLSTVQFASTKKHFHEYVPIIQSPKNWSRFKYYMFL